jgi:hydrogenase maturation protein HypF
MAQFPMCPDCAEEYHDPRNRRFHAQPVACAGCGPHVWLESSRFELDLKKDPIAEAQRLIAEGNIIAIKGLGGFHLACDAADPSAVNLLRTRKLRVDKPFAVMMLDLATVEENCFLTQEEANLLTSPQHPIVILRRKPDCTLPASLTPGQDTLGVMLPYTPLHYLLLTDMQNSQVKQILVMTSGNFSEEPIAIDNQEALSRLEPLADAFLLHNRPIRTRCDDSVMRVIRSNPNEILPIRRSRGYAPQPIRLNWESPELLSAGTELKNTFCMLRGQYAFVSHHIGDMENFETFQSFETGIKQYENLFRIKPQAIACDLHPDYLATRYAQERADRERIPLIPVQHHHAHIASCMAENEIPSDESVIGLAFDGTGYGDDGAIWGGEWLVANYKNYQRFGHLRYLPLPGGDAAIHNPARTALAYLWASQKDWNGDLPPVLALAEQEKLALQYQLEHSINIVQTSSMGRLFDAIAALIGVRAKVNYEAQAAIELEAMAAPDEKGKYTFNMLNSGKGGLIFDPTPLLQEISQDFMQGVDPAIISARFHNAIVELISSSLMAMRDTFHINTVVLSGGVWQNIVLLQKTLQKLRYNGFTVLTHSQVPPNDGGVSLGQAVIAYHHFIGESSHGG